MEFRPTKNAKALDPDVLSVKMNSWPECYYVEQEPEIRRQLLDEAQRLELTPEDNRIREFLFEKRYTPGKNGWIDNYLKAWMEFKYLYGSENGLFGNKRNQKRVRKLFADFGEPEIRNMGSRAVGILSQEYEHCALVYYALSSDAPAYRSIIFGFGSVSDEKVFRRLYGDFKLVSVIMPEKLEMKDELYLWCESVKRALKKIAPSEEL